MKRKEQTKTFMMISNIYNDLKLKKPFDLHVL